MSDQLAQKITTLESYAHQEFPPGVIEITDFVQYVTATLDEAYKLTGIQPLRDRIDNVLGLAWLRHAEENILKLQAANDSASALVFAERAEQALIAAGRNEVDTTQMRSRLEAGVKTELADPETVTSVAN